MRAVEPTLPKFVKLFKILRLRAVKPTLGAFVDSTTMTSREPCLTYKISIPGKPYWWQ